MKTAAKILVAAAALAAAGCTLLPKDPFPPLHPHWSDYQSRQARHYASFPGKTKETVKEGKTLSGTRVSTSLRELQLGDRYYGTAWTLVPTPPVGSPAEARLLEIASNEALKVAPGATLVNKHAVVLDGLNGLTYVIDLPQTRTRLRQQIFLVSGVLVEQSYSGPTGTETEREAGRFFDSLKLFP